MESEGIDGDDGMEIDFCWLSFFAAPEKLSAAADWKFAEKIRNDAKAEKA